MNVQRLIARLEQSGKMLPMMVDGLTREEARWKPLSGAWSILEVVCHLGDEEVQDFQTRLRMTLDDPAQVWPRNDPEEWARSRDYNSKDLRIETERFVSERAKSLAWLRSLKNPNWDATVQRSGHVIRAGDLMVSWTAHDALHIRQIAKRLYELAGEDGKPEEFSTRYAGEWGA